MIIDSSSTNNLVSLEMVEKLGLEKLVHPTPYKVSWLHKRHQVLVNEQCNIQFKIGIYQDELICNVIPMDAFHVLLGRTWQFEKRQIHDGRNNTYIFENDGKGHTVVPLKNEGAII